MFSNVLVTVGQSRKAAKIARNVSCALEHLSLGISGFEGSEVEARALSYSAILEDKLVGQR